MPATAEAVVLSSAVALAARAEAPEVAEFQVEAAEAESPVAELAAA